MLRRLATLGLLSLAGCAAPGDLAISTDLVDFGPALPGVERTQTIDLINPGASALEVTEVRQTGGTAVFSLPLPARLRLSPSQTRTVEVHYLPVASAAADEATFELITDVRGVTATVKARGLPTTPDCAGPAAFDFGAVARGDTFRLEASLANGTATEAIAFVGPIESQQGDGTYVFASGSPSGSFAVPAGGPGVVAIEFKPTEARDYIATVRMRRHQLCAEKPVRLIGTGVAAVLTWSPPLADFGSVSVGAEGRVSITFTNQMLRPVEISGLEAQEGGQASTSFRLAADHLTVPAGVRGGDSVILPGTAQLELIFAPGTVGPRAGQVSGQTALGSQPVVSVTLRGIGAP